MHEKLEKISNDKLANISMSKYCFRCRVRVDVNYGFSAFAVSFRSKLLQLPRARKVSFVFQNISFLRFRFHVSSFIFGRELPPELKENIQHKITIL